MDSTAASNVILRVGTLGTRFALVFILAKYLDAASVGYYGLFTATVGYALLSVGMDFYIYSSREITRTEQSNRGRLLKSQVALAGILYSIIIPASIFVLPSSGFPNILLWMFIPILVLEHLNQEIYRLLIILSHQLSASVLLFVRQGSWALAIAMLMALNESSRNLTTVMILWACAGALAATAGIWKLRSMEFGGWDKRIDWGWIRKGIVVSGAFLIATLAVRAIQTFDRYWLEALAGIEVVAAYVLFFGVASALSVFLDAAIYSFQYPEFVRLGNSKKYKEMHHKVRRMALQTLGFSLAFSFASALALPLLLGWLGDPIYQSEINLYYWVLGGVIVLSLSMAPHYALYALGEDRAIIASHLAALLVFVATTLGLSQVSRLYAVPVGVLISMAAVLLWKTVAYLRVMHHHAQGDEAPC